METEKFSVSRTGSVTHAPTSDSGSYWNTFTFFGGQRGNQLTINNKEGHLWLKHWNSSTASGNWRRVAEIPDLFSGDYNDLSNKLSAGNNISISTTNEISAVDTKYSAGARMSLSGTTFSANKQTWGDIQNKPNDLAKTGDIKDGTLSISTGSLLTGSGSFSANQGSNESIDIDLTQATKDKINNGTQTLNFNSNNGNLSISGGNIVGLDSRYPIKGSLPSSIHSTDVRKMSGSDGTYSYMPAPNDPVLDESLVLLFSKDVPSSVSGSLASILTAKAWREENLSYTAWQLAGNASTLSSNSDKFAIRTGNGATWNDWKIIATEEWVNAQSYLKSVNLSSSLSGNNLTVSNDAGGSTTVDIGASFLSIDKDNPNPIIDN
ncbi:MAG TPA: hypothetical protein VK031_09350, partial [Tissierellaceae bacterium]|nr:hypothetical protein [Tissierellaceae bacterium]